MHMCICTCARAHAHTYTCLQAVDALVQPTEGVDPKQMAMLVEAIDEVQPMVGQAEAEDDELDDEI